MKTIKVKFIDFFGIKPEDTAYYRILARHYDVRLCEDPDYVIDGGLGREHVNYDCIKILNIGESYVPDFNQFDYAIGFDFLEFGDRYLRLPLFAFYPQFRELGGGEGLRRPTGDELRALARREFCSFVVSNGDGDPMRLAFFRRLSKYRPVASGGKLFNNVGGRVADKSAFIAKYKFNIAFENSVAPGYTTEKVMEPLAVRSVPIYYGNPRIAEDFDPSCMVRVASRDDIERAVDEIVALDRDDDAYLAKLAAPGPVRPFRWYEERLEEFLCHIFDQPLPEARRLNAYGYQVNIRRRLRRLWNMYEWTHPGRIFKNIKSRMGRS